MTDFRQRWQPTGINPLVNSPINALFVDPNPQPTVDLPAQRTYHIAKKAKVTKKARKHSKMSLNTRIRRGEDGCLVKGYAQMPHNCAVLKPMTGMFWLTLHINNMEEYTQLDVDCPPAECPHGFLILFKEKVVSLDANIKDFIYRQDVPGVHDTL